ncbi:MAG: D-glycero-beta-D-manno-heptose-7-phosphate kinase [Rhodospirillales bacterium]|jgi:D-beta-D-heptose 7-phosphate kinase / D-beta-D-heptose 1-phosphate adenosyltransferase|nr:D-glycero-beta-D-manno-heptose-7-phosphate kinase [Rhodospirillales bacterium]
MSERADLIPLIEALGTARVLTVGDAMLDRFVSGTVERISPEAPIPVLCITDEQAMLGGAGNVIRNLGALGVGGRYVGVIGDDGAGVDVEKFLTEYPSIESTLITDAGRRTSIKSRFVAGTQQILRADREDIRPIEGEVAKSLMAEIDLGLADCDVVVLSDYGKGVLSPGIVREIIARARAAGRPVFVDPKGEDYSVYQGAGLLTPNRQELSLAARMPTTSDDQIVAAARVIIENCGVEAVLATRSAEGMTLVTEKGEIHHLPTEAREVYDVSGAGDTVVATMAAAVGVGADLQAAAGLANVAAGVVVGKVGTAAAYAGEVIAALHHRDLSQAEAKILALPSALDRIEVWRRNGLRVGFTNGCFDLLHPGHVTLLAKARAACDRLIVGLNSDASVKRLKGPERPVNGEMARATVLASLTSVDMLVFFSEDTPKEIIEATRPDVLVKGADYAVAEVVGADFVQENGGQVFLVDIEPGHSTTATLARLNGAGSDT